MNIVLSFCSLGNDSLLWGEVENIFPFTTTPCPEPRPRKSPTWSSRKKSRPLPPPAPLEPPLWRTSGCTLWKETRGGREMGWLSACDVHSNLAVNEAAASNTSHFPRRFSHVSHGEVTGDSSLQTSLTWLMMIFGLNRVFVPLSVNSCNRSKSHHKHQKHYKN